MEFLSNRFVNYLNLHNGFVEMLNQIVLIFGSLFLYQHGFSMAAVFFLLGLVPLGRIATRPLAFVLISRIGLRNTVAVGLIGWCASILPLAHVNSVNGWFMGYLIIYTVFNPIYWVCFHTYYTLMGEERKRGRHYAVRGACILGGQAVFPILGAEIIRLFGFSWYFALAVPVGAIALALLLMCPDIRIPRISWKWPHEQIRSVGVRTSIFQSSYETINSTLWVFMLFLFFGERYVPFGGMMAFAVIVQIVLQLLIGDRFDKGHAKGIADIGCGTMATIIIARALIPLSLPVIMCIEAMSAVARLHLRSVIEIATYNDSHHAEQVIWYWFSTEVTRDIGAICGTWTVALLLYFSAAPHTAIIFALPSLLILWYVLVQVTTERAKIATTDGLPHQ